MASVLDNKDGVLGAVANTAIFIQGTDSNGACRIRSRFTLPDEAATARIVRTAFDEGGAAASQRLQGATLNPGESLILDLLMATLDDEFEAWQTVGADVEFFIDGIDDL